VRASVRRFREEFLQHYDPGERASDVAGQVQRPAAQYLGRYQERAGEAKDILKQFGGGGPGVPTYQTDSQRVTLPGIDNSGARKAALQDYVLNGKQDPNSLLNLGYSLRGAQDQPSSSFNVPGFDKADPINLRAARPGAANALNWAESKLGFQEATGSNDGGLADRLNRKFGMSGQPWCAMFTSLAVTKGGAPQEAKTASVAQVRAKAQSKQGYRGFVNPAKAKPGDLVLWGNDHIGMVRSVKNGKIQYVAGNESNGVNRGEVDVGSVDVVRPKYRGRR
jgi:hypothetical protein